MEELIDVLDEDGNKTGRIETRKKVHQEGLYHRIVVIAIIDKSGNLLMQQRSIKKKTNPEKWDISVAGHVSSGQTSIQAAIREVKEEVGIDINEEELKFICTYKSGGKLFNNYIANHINDFYIVRRDKIDLDKIQMQEDEVQDIKLCDKRTIQDIISSNNIVKREKAYEALFKYLD